MSSDIHQLSIQEWGPGKATAIIGTHPSLVETLTRAGRFAGSESPVLITGETGTGKELFARALYLNAHHHRRAFLSVNCAQYCGTELVASELFGHRRGAFTGATADHRGIFEEADGGTVFLDEIGDLPLTAQAMLLRTLGEGEVVPVGCTRAKQVNVRVIAATSRDLKPMIASGKFRADLYYRLRQLHLQIPPLRERGDDWRVIAGYYLERLCERNRSPKGLSTDAVRRLQNHRWPGNVREVKSVVDTGFHMAMGPTIEVDDFCEALEQIERNQQLDQVAALMASSSARGSWRGSSASGKPCIAPSWTAS
jgi:two-component system NtrC family response regulator